MVIDYDQWLTNEDGAPILCCIHGIARPCIECQTEEADHQYDEQEDRK